MKKVAFIGAYDKTDMLIYLAKILTLMNKKVLLVDNTTLKKSRYIVPTMIQEKKYITNYEDIDVAIGFESLEEIKKYQKSIFGQEIEYDIALLDIDRAVSYKKLKLSSEDKHYLVTSFDVYNVKRAIQILAHIDNEAVVTRIYYTTNMLREEDDYLKYLSRNISVKWDEKNIVYFPFETEVLNAIFVNQRSGRIQMKGLSKGYTDSIFYLAEDISQESSTNVRKAFKRL